MKPKTIMIDDEKYVRESDIDSMKLATNTDGMNYVLVRCENAGVFAGYLKKHDKQEITLVDSRRLHTWYGASLSQVAQEGLVDYSKCRVAMIVQENYFPLMFEMQHCTEKARKSIQGCPEWKL